MLLAVSSKAMKMIDHFTTASDMEKLLKMLPFKLKCHCSNSKCCCSNAKCCRLSAKCHQSNAKCHQSNAKCYCSNSKCCCSSANRTYKPTKNATHKLQRSSICRKLQHSPQFEPAHEKKGVTYGCTVLRYGHLKSADRIGRSLP